MAEIALKGNMKVKTLKADFKKAFGASLRVYKSATCKGAFADDDATLASIRAEGKAGGELKIVGNMQEVTLRRRLLRCTVLAFRLLMQRTLSWQTIAVLSPQQVVLDYSPSKAGESDRSSAYKRILLQSIKLQ